MRRGWLWLALAGCAAKRDYQSAVSTDGYGWSEEGAARDFAKASADEEYAPSPAAPPPPPPAEPAAALQGGAPSPTGPAGSPADTRQAPAERKVHYEGWARLRVSDPDRTLDEVIALAERLGGRTDRLSGSAVTVRVPVAAFEEAYRAVLALGDVMDRSVRADDVTDAFLAVDLRVRTLKATRDRLIELLAKATEERQKLVLLQEITRVTTELDALESQLRTLADLADLSRITVEAVPREAFTGPEQAPPLRGFEWIAALSPFRRSVWEDDHRVALPVPEGLVALAEKGPFAAESPEGVVLWTQRLENDPAGSAGFWAVAVEDRLGQEFESPTREEIGGWSCLQLGEPGTDTPYWWWVCAAVEGRHLHVAQAWFPDTEAFERYGAAIRSSLAGGGGS